MLSRGLRSIIRGRLTDHASAAGATPQGVSPVHSTPTAREIRRTMIVSEIKLCVIVRSFAQ